MHNKLIIFKNMNADQFIIYLPCTPVTEVQQSLNELTLNAGTTGN